MSEIQDVITSAFVLEERCALNYAVTTAWPSRVDADDREAEDLLESCWSAEKGFLGRLASFISEHSGGGSALVDSSYQFSPARLNFARWVRVVEVLPELIADECDLVAGLLERAAADREARELLNSLLETKREGVDRMRAFQAELERRRQPVPEEEPKVD